MTEKVETMSNALPKGAGMGAVARKFLVLSGKGGVGKSTVAVNLAVAMALQGKRVGLLDVDVHGPSVPKLLNIENEPVLGNGEALVPVTRTFGRGSLSVMSVGLLLRQRDDAVIWRGPKKHGVIKQLIENVEWKELDAVVVDSPPGTGDEPLAVTQLIGSPDGAVIVTTPQEIAVQDVRRCVVFCRELDLPVLGVVENMSGFACPKCGEVFPIFGADGGLKMAQEMGIGFLGAIPIEPRIVVEADAGSPVVTAFPESPAAVLFSKIAAELLQKEPRASKKCDQEERCCGRQTACGESNCAARGSQGA